MSRSICLAALFVGLAGCAALSPMPALTDLDLPQRECRAQLDAADRIVRADGKGDAEGVRVPGFPYLRLDRFTASFVQAASADQERERAWIARARQLDRQARHFEIANLGNDARDRLATLLAGKGDVADRRPVDDRATIEAVLDRCGDALARVEPTRPQLRRALLERAEVADDYSTVDRVVGLYPLSRLVVAAGVRRDQARTRARFAEPPPEGPVVRSGLASPPPTAAAISAWYRSVPRDTLGIPMLDERQARLLFERHAPIVEIASSAPADLIGAMAWGRDDLPRTDPDQSAVYRRFAYTRMGGETLLQIVYTVWFPERSRRGSADILAGRLDGIVWRVTLAADGRPVVADTMHPCGCWHMFFPAPGIHIRPAPDASPEWAFAPAGLPVVADGERIVLRLTAGTHQLVGIGASRIVPDRPLSLLDEDALRSLPTSHGDRRSLYRPDGIVDASRRPERLLFWPMGISSAGAMRQWGHHATAFVGRRHFDDVDLIERRFEFER